MPSLANIAVVALGGAIGSCLRYGIGQIEPLSNRMGLSTFIVNVLGCLIIGVLFGICSRCEVAGQLRLLIFVGLLGGFTTFSTYALDVVVMFHEGAMLRALIYLLATNVLGIFAAAVGYYSVGYFMKIIA